MVLSLRAIVAALRRASQEGSRVVHIGLLGGSFNPPHLGHLALARAVLAALELDQVLLIPAARPPHKPAHPELAPAEDRLAMARLLAETDPGLAVSDIELERAGPSYTIDTVRALQAARPGDELVWIIGADTLGELPTWKEAAALLALVPFVVVGRPGYPLERELEELAHGLGQPAVDALRLRVVTMEPSNQSSTAIRRRIREQQPWADDVPPAVAAYIESHGLYTGGSS